MSLVRSSCGGRDVCFLLFFFFFFFNDTATTEIYTLSYTTLFRSPCRTIRTKPSLHSTRSTTRRSCRSRRSEEHTSELQSRLHLVCRLLLEKKKKKKMNKTPSITK